jgi:nucleoside-diphosphate-sugar epimerase
VRVLLTGGSGFVGRHLVARIRDRYDIIAPGHGELDITDSAAVDDYFASNAFDAVIHAAIQGGSGVFESTLRGYWNIARHATRVDRVLYFGSGAEFGKHRDLIKVSEESVGEHLPRDPYGFAKLICNQFARQSKNIINLRLFGIFGEFEGYTSKFISNAVAKALFGLPIVIKQDVVFDYLWIEDLVRLMPFFLESDYTWSDVNITPTESVSLTDIASLVVAGVGSDIKINVENPGLNWQYTGDNRRLLELVPHFEFTSVACGVQRLVDYYRLHQQDIECDELVRDDYRLRCTTRPSDEMRRETQR